MRRNILGIASVAAMGALMAMPAVGGDVEVVHRDLGRASGYRMGRRSRPQAHVGGYPGAKLAKKAAKGTLTHNGIR